MLDAGEHKSIEGGGVGGGGGGGESVNGNFEVNICNRKLRPLAIGHDSSMYKLFISKTLLYPQRKGLKALGFDMLNTRFEARVYGAGL